MQRNAEIVLELLEQYLVTQEYWEKHLENCATGVFWGKAAEQASHRFYQDNHLIPFMEKCRVHGLSITTFRDIIPGPFETTTDERARLFDAYTKWAAQEFAR